MRWEQLPINTTFTRARRREVYRRLYGIIRRRAPAELLPLDSLRSRVRLFEQTYMGVNPIRVDRIVGTAGRSEDFDSNWLPRRPDVAERWMRLERTFPDGDWPPIIVYQVGESYFVVDGHHRVALAKQKEIEFIDAEVTRLRARFPIPDDMDVGQMIRAEQQQLFMENCGLAKRRPDAVIEMSQAHGYVELLELIEVHAYHLGVERGELAPLDEAARDFYDKIYVPTVDAIRSEGLLEAFPNTTEADLFMGVYERMRSLFPEHGSLELGEVVRKFAD